MKPEGVLKHRTSTERPRKSIFDHVAVGSPASVLVSGLSGWSCAWRDDVSRGGKWSKAEILMALWCTQKSQRWQQFNKWAVVLKCVWKDQALHLDEYGGCHVDVLLILTEHLVDLLYELLQLREKHGVADRMFLVIHSSNSASLTNSMFCFVMFFFFFRYPCVSPWQRNGPGYFLKHLACHQRERIKGEVPTRMLSGSLPVRWNTIRIFKNKGKKVSLGVSYLSTWLVLFLFTQGRATVK